MSIISSTNSIRVWKPKQEAVKQMPVLFIIFIQFTLNSKKILVPKQSNNALHTGHKNNYVIGKVAKS